jgi:hypothetical protein
MLIKKHNSKNGTYEVKKKLNPLFTPKLFFEVKYRQQAVLLYITASQLPKPHNIKGFQRQFLQIARNLKVP